MCFEFPDNLAAVLVISDSADYQRVGTELIRLIELSGMVGEICRRSPQLLSCREDVPKDFADTYDKSIYIFHGLNL